MPAQEEARVKPKSNLDFRLMSLTYNLRDFIKPRMRVLEETGIKRGFHVLDYGCGPGSYIAPLAELVGKSGKIYALDVHPLAVRTVQRLASRKGLDNVETILSNCKTGLPSDSLDIVILYDILHDLDNTDGVLMELHRVLKPEGILSLSDHHLKEAEIVSQITAGGLFKLSAKGKRTYSFSRKEQA
jgi:ubiquinone/menaquinone biosynthesis C-methylase UbiE